MKNKILTAILALSFPFTLAACGTDSASTSNNPVSEPNSALTTGVLEPIINDYVGTYTTNTTNVSEYYFKNKNYTLDKSFDELDNVSYINARHYTDGTKNSYINFSDIEDFKHGVTLNNDSSFSLYFEGSGEEHFINFSGIDDLDCYHTVGSHSEAATYGEFIDEGCLFLDSEYSYSGIDINNFMNVSFPKGLSDLEQLEEFKNLFGRPSIVVENTGSAGTVHTIDLFWCFENTTIKFTVMDSSGSILLSNCTFYWRNYEQTIDSLLGVSNINLVGYTPSSNKDEKDTTSKKDTNSDNQYALNIPSDITLTFDDKEVSILNKSASDIFSELGVPSEDINQANYGDSSYELYTSFAYDSLTEGVSIDEKYVSSGYTIDNMQVYMHTGFFIPDITFLGIKPLDTPADFQKIYGRCDNVSTGSKNEKYYKYNNITINNAEICITIKTFNDVVSYVSIDSIDYLD